MIEGLTEVGRDAGAVAVRLEPRLERNSPAIAMFDDLGLRADRRTLQVGQTQMLDIQGDESAIFASADGQTRRKIRRAARDGVRVDVTRDPAATESVQRLQRLVQKTERRSGVSGRGTERIAIAWREFAARGRAAIVEAWVGTHVMASGMVVLVGDRSFYLFSGSLREAPGERKKFPSYAMHWEMVRVARSLGSRVHDLWGIEPCGAGAQHPWHGIGTFKRSFGGRSLVWAGGWDIVIRSRLYLLRSAWSLARGRSARVRGLSRGTVYGLHKDVANRA